MRLRVLGPVEVEAGDGTLTHARPQLSVVLAALMVDVGRPVPVERLVDRVWGEHPPVRARRLLHTHVARIRRLLAEASAVDGDTAEVVRRSGGYVLEADPQLVDLHRFRALVSRSNASGLSAVDRAGLLGEALDLWGSEALAGLSGEWIERCRQAWEQQRLAARIAWARAELDDGNPTAVIGLLTDELDSYPLVEPATAVLMQALYATGRGAEALERYAAVQQRLADELGASPGAELQAVHQTILRGEPAARPVSRPAAPASRTTDPPRPAQLPADVRDFTGRDAELSRLDALLVNDEEKAPMVVSAVSGMAGVGKTTLALHWAHRVQERFPDGQLYINLRGYDPDRPVAPADALDRFLSALGLADYEIPPELDDRAARYRTTVAARRMLVVLDNASTAEQVRPLLPGTGSCAVVVTSRDSLAGLIAVDGARRVDLDLLPADDAAALLSRLIGPRADAEPTAVARLVDQCARLPLALRVAAELAVDRPRTPLAELVDELADHRRRLDLLSAGEDSRSAVSAVFSWSFRQLPAEAAHTFRLLGLHPGTDFDAYAAAALADTDLDQTRQALLRLVRASLVQPAGAGRYGMHDLLRAYAASLAADDPDSPGALDRLLDYYLATAAAAMDTLYPHEAHLRPSMPAAATPAPDVAGWQPARAWLDAELACLVAIAAHAATHDRPTHAVRLSTTVARHLETGHFTDAFAIHGCALDAARQVGDKTAEARVQLDLGATYGRLGQHQQAVGHLEDALALFRNAGERTGQARAYEFLGLTWGRLGQYKQATRYYQDAIALAQEAEDRSRVASATTGLGIIELRSGRYRAAAEHHEAALAAIRQVGNRMGEANALNNLGLAEERMGNYDRSIDHLERALALFQELGSRRGEAAALDNLGVVEKHFDPDRATQHLQRALALVHEMGDRDGEPSVHNSLGEAALAADRTADTVAHHQAALELATETGDIDQQARAHTGLGASHQASGNPSKARTHYQHALARYTDLELPDADDVRARLTALESAG